jgi:gliding motility-associated-like protein
MKKILLIIFVLVVNTELFATHVVGGNFVITQTGPNTFNIVCRFYRDCGAGNAAMPTSLSVGVYDKVTNALVQNLTMTNPVITNIALGDACYTPTGICVQEGLFTLTNVNIPNNPNGYYLQTQVYARNGIILNIQNPGSTGMSFYAEIPDPAIPGMNSSPDFGPYPSDGYLCISNTKLINFNVTDPDGDSLVYSLVTPLASVGTGNLTQPGPYPDVTWQAPYSLADIVGGTPVMSINPVTGTITAAPSVLGTFVFAVRVEEYRNGIKIGEVRRDVQYRSLNCTVDSPPQFINQQSVINVYVDQNACFDILALDTDGQDTIYLDVSSPDINIAQSFIPPTNNGNGTYTYNNFQGSGNLTVNHFVQNGTNFEGVGQIPMRFCFTPTCQDVNETFSLSLISYSLGCAGSDTVQTNVTINVVGTQPQINLNIPDTVSVTYGDQLCFELFASDTINVNDTLFIHPYGSNFDYLGTYVAPSSILINNQTQYYYTNFMSTDTVWLTNYSYNNGIVGAMVNVPVRYCMVADCDDVFQERYVLNYMAYSTSCGSDTVYKNPTVLVDPPVSQLETIPNVFSPNNDGVNDYFKIAGISDPCLDSVTVSIYNRWGHKVFESNNINFEWDGKNKNGKPMSDGVYFVIIDGIYAGNNIKRQYPLTLIR